MFSRFLGYHQYLLPQHFHHYDKISIFISCCFPFLPPWALATTNLFSDSLCFPILGLLLNRIMQHAFCLFACLFFSLLLFFSSAFLSSLKHIQGSSILHIYPSLKFFHTSPILTNKISGNIISHFWVLSWRRQYVKAMNYCYN